jgi:hypothetical protein
MGGRVGQLRFGGVDLGGRVGLLDGLALRGSTAASLSDADSVEWRAGRFWLGAEAYYPLRLGGGTLSLGASVEVGAPAYGDGLVLRFDSLGYEGNDEWLGRARAGVRLSGDWGFAQLEGARVLGAPEYIPGVWSVIASTVVPLDKRYAIEVDAGWVPEARTWLRVSYWATLWGNPWRARTLVGVTVVGGNGDALAVGVSVLHQR